MSSSASLTNGVLFQRETVASGGTFATIAEITNVGEISAESPLVDVSSYDSLAREYLGGLPDGAEFDIEFNFIMGSSGQVGLRTNQTAGTPWNFKVQLNDFPSGTDSTISFAAVVRKFGVTFGTVDNPIRGSATLKVSGAITWTAGS